MDMRLIRRQMKKGEPFVTCSESLTGMYRMRERLEIPYIRNGVDVSRYPKRDRKETEELRRKLGLPSDKILFVYSGGMIERKNQKEAIEGVLQMKEGAKAALLLLGDGRDRAGLENAYGKQKNIIFRGKVSNVKEYLHASDVYLSTSRSEGLPNGVLEAMACGLPVLLSDISQHLEVLEADEGCGHAYRLGDVDELSRRLDFMMQEDLVQMGEKSCAAVSEHFTAEGMSRQYQELYRKILGR